MSVPMTALMSDHDDRQRERQLERGDAPGGW